MVEEMEAVLQRPLVDDEGTPLVRDQDAEVRRRTGPAFKLDAIDIRSPQRKADVEKNLQDAMADRRSRPSTTATAS